MAGRGEYEPRDSREVTGTAGDPRKSWREQEPQTPLNRGEYEPGDSRNVTGTATTSDGRWTNRDGKPPEADGLPPRERARRKREDTEGG